MEDFTQCPGIDVLERYACGSLPPKELKSFESHLEFCGICGVLVGRLKELEMEPESASSAREPDWATMEARIEAECERIAVPRLPAPGRRPWLTASFWIPALGYGMALALVYPAWLGVTKQHGQSVPQEASPAAARRIPAARPGAIVDLNTTRNEENLPVVTDSDGRSAVVLSFFVPAPREARQTAAILDRENNVVHDIGVIKSYDGRGNYCVIVDVGSLRAGHYRLVVTEATAAGGHQDTFEFERR